MFPTISHMSFRLKTILGITIIQAFILLTIVCNAHRLMQQTLEQELHQRAKTAAGLFATTTKDGVLSMDLASLDSFVEEVMHNPDVVYARVLDRHGRVLAQGGPPQMLAAAFNEDHSINPADGIYDVSAEIAETGILYGRVEVGLAVKEIHGSLEFARTRIVQVGGFQVLVSLLLSGLLGTYLSRRISRLKEASEQITAGNIGYQIEVSSKDEIGTTERAFNQMSAHIRILLAEITEKNQRLEEEVARRKKAEAQLQNAHDDLERRVARRTAELAETNRQLTIEIGQRLTAFKEKEAMAVQLQRSKKMEALGELAGGVAHDLNNVLSGVMSYPELLLCRLPADSEMRKPIEVIRNSGKKAAAIVQDLLTMARRGVLVNEVVALNALVLEYLDSPEFGELRLRHPHVSFRTGLADELFLLNGSPVHLSKTVMNLVTNGAEAMGEQGGEVFISSENRVVAESRQGYENIEPGSYVVLCVSDQGNGIAESDREKIFEPFFTRKHMGTNSGTGLGLAVVWGTVKDHDGFIDIFSDPVRGTTFELYFPCNESILRKVEGSADNRSSCETGDTVGPGAGAGAGTGSENGTGPETWPGTADLVSSAYRGHGENLLIVDDSAEQLEIASAILLQLGYAVTAVSSGEDALDYLVDHIPDLVLLDMIMAPGIDGLQTYMGINARYPQMKTLIVSGFSESGLVRRAQKLGAGPYVKKPYTMQGIARAIHGVLSGNSAMA